MVDILPTSGSFQLVHNRHRKHSGTVEGADSILPATGTAAARREISAWPNYEPTPLAGLPGVAERIRVGGIWYKNEGGRFGVGSFKPLGGGFAVSRIVARQVMQSTGINRLSSINLLNGQFAEDASRVTVTCATDGNHGRAVAWAASRFGCRAVVYMASIVSPFREEAIAAFGAETVRSKGTHEDAARECRADAKKLGWHVVSETENATEPQIALDTLAGYTTLFDEIHSQLPEGPPPTHMFVQAGVGGLAGTAAAYTAQLWGVDRPILVVVEASSADCICRSLLEGEPATVNGELETIMAGLAAGEVSGYAWKLLREGANFGMTIEDDAAVATMRLLADAPYGDQPLVGGESGVAGLAAALLAAGDPITREKLGLDESATILTIGTEGATDPTVYRRIVGRQPKDVVSEGSW